MKHAQVMTVVQWARGATWRIGLQHSCRKHALVWITRGQGIAVIGGVRRGIGVHNALLIPAGTMFSLDPGKTGFGLVCEGGEVRGLCVGVGSGCSSHRPWVSRVYVL